MAQLVLHFGWTWVGIIAADDDYGKYGIKDFKEQVEEAGVCISFSETLPKVNHCYSESLVHGLRTEDCDPATAWVNSVFRDVSSLILVSLNI